LLKSQQSQLLALWLTRCLLVFQHFVLRRQSSHERNSEYWILILIWKSWCRKNFASNARRLNIELINALKSLRCTKLLQIQKMICFHQSHDWEQHAHILFYQHIWWFIWFQVIYCWCHLEKSRKDISIFCSDKYWSHWHDFHWWISDVRVMWMLWYSVSIVVKIEVDLIIWWNVQLKVDYICFVYIDHDTETQE
jgi:hypothetical protein